MKRIHTALTLLATIALAAFSAGCSSELQEKENLAVEAGFKVVFPVKLEDQAVIGTLRANTVTQTSYRGAIYYVIPDAKNAQAYVGGPKEYQAYRRLREEKGLGNEPAQVNEASTVDWSCRGGSVGAAGPRK